MKKHENGVSEGVATVVKDTRALLAATADATEEKVIQARERITEALDQAKDTYAFVQKKAIAGVKAGDNLVRENPYRAIGIALGVGALIGYFLRRQK